MCGLGEWPRWQCPRIWWGEAPERTWRLLRERQCWNKLSRLGSMGPPSRFQRVAAIQGFGIGLNNVQPAIHNPSKMAHAGPRLGDIRRRTS